MDQSVPWSRRIDRGVEAQRDAIEKEIEDGVFDGEAHLASSPAVIALRAGVLPNLRLHGPVRGREGTAKEEGEPSL